MACSPPRRYSRSTYAQLTARRVIGSCTTIDGGRAGTHAPAGAPASARTTGAGLHPAAGTEVQRSHAAVVLAHGVFAPLATPRGVVVSEWAAPMINHTL